MGFINIMTERPRPSVRPCLSVRVCDRPTDRPTVVRTACVTDRGPPNQLQNGLILITGRGQ